uniref:Carbonic anhydrase 4 n=1 Tax=Cyprinus carpio TaxID=7962 RepID=A0A8C1SIZ6_CYPCA
MLCDPTYPISESPLDAQQLHLHWGKNGGPGSEYTIDGEKYPMELHIVHIKENYKSVKQAINDPSGVAVLGLFYELKPQIANKKYDGIINSLKNITHPGTNVTLPAVSLDMLILPHNELERYFRYQGSLTTPGCSEDNLLCNTIYYVFLCVLALPYLSALYQNFY